MVLEVEVFTRAQAASTNTWQGPLGRIPSRLNKHTSESRGEPQGQVSVELVARRCPWYLTG